MIEMRIEKGKMWYFIGSILNDSILNDSIVNDSIVYD